MKLTKALENAVTFARWCRTYDIQPSVAAELIMLARKRYAAAVAKHNGGSSKREENARMRFEEAARKLGFVAQWNGLWPTLVLWDNYNHDVHIPDIS